jgi:enoyl-CoA hydratase/carnithine racemase
VKNEVDQEMENTLNPVRDELLVEQHDALLSITINRAAKANAMTVDIMERIVAAMTQAAGDPGVSSIVLTGAGERVFCAGVDIREQPADGDVARQRERRSLALAALQDAVMSTPKPVVVVLNGIATGAGAMLALLADACVAVDTAKLSLPEIDIGIATFSGANILEVIGGRALALDLIQSGRRMGAEEGRSRGLVNVIAQRDDLAKAGNEVALLLGAKQARVFADNKRWINRALKRALEEARLEHAKHRVSMQSEHSV